MSARTDAAWELWLANRLAVQALRRADRAGLTGRDRTPKTGPNGEDLVHGLATYNKHRCSCDDCRGPKNAYMAQWRAEQRLADREAAA